MIADTTFASHLLREEHRQAGPAMRFLAARRLLEIRLTIISAGEISVLFRNATLAWEWLAHWAIYRLHRGIVDAAADIDRRLLREGRRLGENDNWFAGFAVYYREPLVSQDAVFDRVPGLHRLRY
jgi:predicted nucleic acid-binding protein